MEINNKFDIIIVGAGLFGSMITTFFQKKGLSTLTISNGNDMSGSKCSAGIFRESFINKSILEKAKIGISILEKTVSIDEVSFGAKEKFNIVLPDKILLPQSQILSDTVLSVKNDAVILLNNSAENHLLVRAKKAVILACGAFTDNLLINSGYSSIGIDSYWGNCFLSKQKATNIYKVWMPYKQICGFQKDSSTYYFSNAQTVKNPSTNDGRIQKGEDRLLNQYIESGLNVDSITHMLQGFRPYLKNKGIDFVNQHDTRLFSATGGAKNSTILCGYVAKTIFEKITK